MRENSKSKQKQEGLNKINSPSQWLTITKEHNFNYK